MIGSLRPYLNVRQFLTGRRIFILRHMLGLAIAGSALAEIIQKALAHDTGTLELEFRWNQTKGDQATNRGEATLIDVEIDKVLAAMETSAHSQLIGSKEDPVYQAAEMFLKTAFPLGLKPLTQQPFEVQLTSVETLLTNLGKAPLSDAVQALGLGRHVAQLQSLVTRFAAELQREKRSQVTFDVVSAAQAEGQELLAEVIAVILGTHHARDAETTARREALLAELNRQDRLVLEAFRRNRRPLDIDPNTGEEVDTDAPVPVPVAPAA